MPHPRKEDLPLWMEGGLVNDRSGKATAKVRKAFATPRPKRGAGNRTMRKFQRGQ